jgi:SnoaL-like protein
VGTITGRDSVAGVFAGVVAALPNAHAALEDIFGQGNEVVVRLVVSGRNRKPSVSLPP